MMFESPFVPILMISTLLILKIEQGQHIWTFSYVSSLGNFWSEDFKAVLTSAHNLFLEGKYINSRVQAGPEFEGEVTSPSRNFREKFAYPREK